MTTQTGTSTTTTGATSLSLDPTSSLPPKLPQHILQHFPNKLTRAQAGHIRHFHNLATQLDGEWAHMGSADPGQENFEAYRYQLSAMAYAAAAAHYHRLPALRSVFRALLEQLIHKLLRRHVWGYWYLGSQSGRAVDPGLAELRRPFPDPVCRENIMYSGHLLLMVSLHAMLFDSDRYDAPGALTFDWNPMFFGMGPEKFEYDRSSLQKCIIDEMEREGWMGVCCEPNCVFIICNQFPLIAIRYNDVRDGTDVVTGVLEKYQAAWGDKNGGFTRPGATGEDGLVFFYMVRQDAFVPSLGALAANAWASAFMNSWNSAFVHEWYSKLIRGYLTRHPDGRVCPNSQPVAREVRAALARGEEEEDAHSLTVSSETSARAAARVQKGLEENGVQSPMGPGTSVSDFGYTMQWLSEVASPPSSDGVDVVGGFLKHADAYMNPSWEHGGLYYPRRDGPARDEEGNYIGVDPYTGNAGIAYGRLNVRDGQKKMWEEPWAKEGHHAKYPFVEGVELSSGIDFLRGEWDDELGVMIITMRTWDGNKRRVDLQVRNLPAGTYGSYQSCQLVQVRQLQAGDVLDILVDEVGGDEVDVIIMRQH